MKPIDQSWNEREGGYLGRYRCACDAPLPHATGKPEFCR